jgi:hypothetical protein
MNVDTEEATVQKMVTVIETLKKRRNFHMRRLKLSNSNQLELEYKRRNAIYQMC